MDNSIDSRVQAIIVRQLNVEASAVGPDKSFVDDLGADSLDVADLLMAIEEEFHLEIAEDQAEKLRTVGDAIAYIAAQKA